MIDNHDIVGSNSLDEGFIVFSPAEHTYIKSLNNDKNCNNLNFFNSISIKLYEFVNVLVSPGFVLFQKIKEYGYDLKSDVITNNCQKNYGKKSVRYCITMRSIEEFNRSFFRMQISDPLRNNKWIFLIEVMKNCYQKQLTKGIKNFALSFSSFQGAQLIKSNPKVNFLLNIFYNGFLLYGNSVAWPRFAVSMVNITASYSLDCEFDITLFLIQFLMNCVLICDSN